MGRILAQELKQEIVLPARYLVGRSPSCDLILNEKTVSGHHAVLEWNGTNWDALDLGSRNGTFVDERRVSPGARIVLARGMCLRFGRTSASWVLTDATAPHLMAQESGTGGTIVGQSGYLALPGGASPEVCVYQAPDGTWLLEKAGELMPAEDRSVITVADGRSWKIHLPTTIAGTLTDREGVVLLAHLRLTFSVSLDEEHVELVASCGEQRWSLLSRAHHYPLLILARQRLSDVKTGVAESELGWIRQEEFSRRLRMDDNHINISIHRARAQFARIGVADAASLIERRSGSRQLRIGANQLEIVTLGTS